MDCVYVVSTVGNPATTAQQMTLESPDIVTVELQYNVLAPSAAKRLVQSNSNLPSYKNSGQIQYTVLFAADRFLLFI